MELILKDGRVVIAIERSSYRRRMARRQLRRRSSRVLDLQRRTVIDDAFLSPRRRRRSSRGRGGTDGGAAGDGRRRRRRAGLVHEPLERPARRAPIHAVRIYRRMRRGALKIRRQRNHRRRPERVQIVSREERVHLFFFFSSLSPTPMISQPHPATPSNPSPPLFLLGTNLIPRQPSLVW